MPPGTHCWMFCRPTCTHYKMVSSTWREEDQDLEQKGARYECPPTRRKVTTHCLGFLSGPPAAKGSCTHGSPPLFGSAALHTCAGPRQDDSGALSLQRCTSAVRGSGGEVRISHALWTVPWTTGENHVWKMALPCAYGGALESLDEEPLSFCSHACGVGGGR